MPLGGWTEVLPDVLCWRDSCNVYAVLGAEAALIVDTGSGAWCEQVDALPVPPRAAVVTHYFRDHAGGAAIAAQMGIDVYVPEHEARMFRDPLQYFLRRETSLIYDNIWDHYVPSEAIKVSGVLRDYERVTIAGIEVEVLPLPGATPTQIGLALRTPRSRKSVVFSGETIHSPGRVPRLAPLQYNYNDLAGVANVGFSADLVRGRNPDLVLPSLGDPISDSPRHALQELHANLLVHTADRPGEQLGLRQIGRDSVDAVSEHVWTSTQARAGSTFIVGKGGRALIIDYGYWYLTGSVDLAPGFDPQLSSAYSRPERRRPLIHSLDALRDLAGVEEYAAVIPTHYHDDHVCGIPLLQRLFGVPCWVPANFAQILADPAGSRFPCTWPKPIRIDRELSLSESFVWDGITFHLGPMSGHTRFAALIGWEVDGTRFVHAGDQYGPADDRLSPREWGSPEFAPNYVYANGAGLDAYRRSAEWICAFRPDVVFSGHWRPTRTDDVYFELLTEYGRRFTEGHQRVMALDAGEPNFGLDSMAGWIWPYRTHVPAPGPISFEVVARNPLATEATLELVLAGPSGWKGSTASVNAGAFAEVSTSMEILPDGPCQRQPVTVELRAGGRSFGQVLEALVTVGGAEF